jgi:hypothetical protein
MTLQIINCGQNSDEWLQARMGIPTASAFSKILAKGEGKTRDEYMRRLVGELITGQPSASFKSEAMERGHEWEPLARDLYAFQTGAELQRVGFVTDGKKGCSPDSLIGDDGGLEIKTAEPHILVDILERNDVPTAHRAQVQGSMWVCKRQWWDVCIYNKDMAETFIKRVTRDEIYIQSLATEVDKFILELEGRTARRTRMAA